MNENWFRWIKSSVAVYFENILGDKLIVEGDSRPSDLSASHYELAVDGPDVDQVGENEYILRVYINLIVVTEASSLNLYAHDERVGLAATCFNKTLPINKYGSKPIDDQSHIGCMNLTSPIRTMKYDMPRPATFYASAFDSEYKFEITE